MKRMGIVGLLLIFCFGLNAQMVYIDPASGGADDEITLYFNAAQGNKELMGASSVYVHHGVVTDNANGTVWKYVKRQLGQRRWHWKNDQNWNRSLATQVESQC